VDTVAGPCDNPSERDLADSLYYATIRYFSIAVLPVSFLVCFVIFFSNPGSLPSKGETTRRVAHLVGAFASDPRLSKMLNQAAIMDTLVEGCRDGVLVLRLRAGCFP